MRNRLRRLRRRWPLLFPGHVSATLDALGIRGLDILLVHASFGGCGMIWGGVSGFHCELKSRCENLVMPTHTWGNPPELVDSIPFFDTATSPSCVGALSEHHRRVPGSVRSSHPTHSVTVTGPDAAEIAAGHAECGTPCGVGTPYSRLLERDCAVLMFGVDFDSYTLFHTAEHLAQVPYLYLENAREFLVVNSQGVQQQIVTRAHDMRHKRCFRGFGLKMEEQGLVRRQKLGRGEICYVPSAQQVNLFVLERLNEAPNALLTERG